MRGSLSRDGDRSPQVDNNLAITQDFECKIRSDPLINAQLKSMNYLQSAARYATTQSGDDDLLTPELALEKINLTLNLVYNNDLVEQVFSLVKALRDAEIRCQPYSVGIFESDIGWLSDQYQLTDVAFIAGVAHLIYDLKQLQENFGDDIGLSPSIDRSFCDKLLLYDDKALLDLLLDKNGFFADYFQKRMMERQPLIDNKIYEDEQN